MTSSVIIVHKPGRFEGKPGPRPTALQARQTCHEAKQQVLQNWTRARLALRGEVGLERWTILLDRVGVFKL